MPTPPAPSTPSPPPKPTPPPTPTPPGGPGTTSSSAASSSAGASTTNSPKNSPSGSASSAAAASSSTTARSQPGSTKPVSSSSSSLSSGAKAGIGVGIALAAVIALVVLFFWYRKRRTQKAQPTGEAYAYPPEKLEDTSTFQKTRPPPAELDATNEVKREEIGGARSPTELDGAAFSSLGRDRTPGYVVVNANTRDQSVETHEMQNLAEPREGDSMLHGDEVVDQPEPPPIPYASKPRP